MYVEYDQVPASFEELWRESELVVRGTIKATKVRRSSASKNAVPVTEQLLDIEEVLKSSPKGHDVGAKLFVLQAAGTLEIDGTLLTVDGGRNMPVLAPGQEVLLFLKPSERGGPEYVPAYGAVGVYVLDGDAVTIPEEAKALRSLFNANSSVPKTDFLSTLKSEAAKRGGRR